MKKFPNMLFVKIEEDSDNDYFVATESLNELGDPGGTVKTAVYELVEIGETVIAVEFRGVGRKK